MPGPELAATLRRPFAEQLAFFRQKLGRLVPTAKWNDLWQTQHDRAFMVAGAAKADLLADLAGAVDRAIAGGETLQSFRDRFAEIVARHGWHGWTGEESARGRAWRTRVIYETNLITSYSAGRLAQLKDGGYEWWIYKHSDFVAHPRPHHVALNGITKRADDPFWQAYSPPNGWGCRCKILGARGPASIRRLGGDLQKPLPQWVGDIDSKTGAPVGVDRGFAYAPGATVAETVRALVAKADALPAPLAAPLRADLTEAQEASALRQAIDGVREAAITDRPRVEYAALIDRAGRELWRKRGGESHVAFTPSEIAAMPDGVLVHNHPGGASLSGQDFALAIAGRLRRIYAIANDGRALYAGRPMVGDAQAMAAAHAAADGDVRGVFTQLIKGGRIRVDEAERWHWHAVNLLLARRKVVLYHAKFEQAPPDWVHVAVKELL